MIITIGGNVGAGKTTLADNLANELHYQQLYVGGIFRDMVAEKNLTIEQFYAHKEDPALEQAVDQRQATMMREKDDLIVQGRVAWYFAKSSPFKVFNILLTVSPMVGAERVGEKKENVGKAADEVAAATGEREKMERERYKMLYGIERPSRPQSNTTLCSTRLRFTEQEVFDKVLWLVKARLA